MSKSEKAILNETMVALSDLPGGALVRRNNVGVGYQGQKLRIPAGVMFRMETGMVVLRNARRITFGLPGSGDIDVCYQGRAISVEVKADDGRQREDQKNFEVAWQTAGGLYVLARSPEQAVRDVLLGV